MREIRLIILDPICSPNKLAIQIADTLFGESLKTTILGIDGKPLRALKGHERQLVFSKEDEDRLKGIRIL